MHNIAGANSLFRIAIATDDGVKVKIGHFGDATYYHIYRVDNSDIIFERRIENPEGLHSKHMHGEEGKRGRLLSLLGGVDAVVSTFYGPGGVEFFEKHGVVPVRVKPGVSIEEALRIALETLRKGR